ncbi:tRNA glutamyl-Q(34) synthetase GluQRS [Aestuariivirga litoralis]|uniref:tRNA glutamyl-Q(34) synthetase GluQRS n=1 Tax=Aestuariivirga litoralis TaxID=2650924 RepID=UPI0018C75F15|nr:tRNA glutamyl-Q(34) synthetase GluQRS [Aestuariivirga litoralis]MBG1233736.1 tRNA glutamyl-Q(34) synthetase GluQRS [Aestuariivirga litoralis]
MNPPVFRFAPSPNGRLHLGHAYSALLNEKLAREAGGTLLLRIEDIDTTRCTETLVQHCIDDLAWLGIAFEPNPRRQSQHMDDYRAALAKLDAMGLLYPCTCTRSDLARLKDAPRDPDGQPLYDGHCRMHGQGTGPAALRLDVAKTGASAASIWGDVILARKDIGTSYHLSVVVDDALQGATHVVRGADMEQATSIHLLLQTLLGLPHPIYQHHDLIRHQTGRKLSKSAEDRSLADMRAEGATPQDVRKLLGF